MKKWIYLGVDQTGAINRKGVPRPLPACLIRGSSVELFYLKEFSKKEILSKVQPTLKEEVIICIDCVLGLPLQVDLSWREALKVIQNFDGYGMQVAKNYFYSIGKGQVHSRSVEIACKANSVFKEKPFQKNIQTGTYRIWKDISFHEQDFFAPALESRSGKEALKIFEGYPSLSWSLLFNSSVRKPKELSKLVRSKLVHVDWTKALQLKVQNDPNLADAFVLAVTMKKLKNRAFSLIPSREGWILGYEQNKLL